MDLAGHALAGRYDLLARLGAGGMGEVYRAHDRELDDIVALKVIRHELASDRGIEERFRREVKLARRVTHRNVARTFEFGFDNGIAFYTMELVDGESLRTRLRRGKLAVADAMSIADEVCHGLEAAHAADVIHRDIKPENVLLANDGRVVVVDFGIASVSLPEGNERSGTPAYMAPEQARGAPATPATDVYAVGVMLYEMLTGTRAFEGTSIAVQHAKEVTRHLELGGVDHDLARIIALATAREPSERIASAAELGRMLAPWVGGAGVQPTAVHAAPSTFELRTVILLPPHALTADKSRAHIAFGIYEAMIEHLAHQPRLRVWPRTMVVAEPGATIVELRFDHELVVHATPPAPQRSLEVRLPLAIESVGDTALAASALVVSVVDGPAPKRPSSEAYELYLQARQIPPIDPPRLAAVRTLLQRAYELAPNDPAISAALAVAEVRNTFFTSDATSEQLANARRLVVTALETSPERADTQLAAGRFELNIGDAARAAVHFRTAIARAPHLAEAHLNLGQMLLEAGFIEHGIARTDHAVAIDPNLLAVGWEVVRALALQQRWEEVDRRIAEMLAANCDRVIARLRLAWWRRDVPGMRVANDLLIATYGSFDSDLLQAVSAVMVDGDWSVQRDRICRMVLTPQLNRRRTAFMAQLCAEVAGAFDDAETSIAMVEHAVGAGVFDLHWLDHCPLLTQVRGSSSYLRYRGRIKRRADAVLDALYGEADAQRSADLSDTVAG